MKKIIIVLLSCVFLLGCGKSEIADNVRIERDDEIVEEEIEDEDNLNNFEDYNVVDEVTEEVEEVEDDLNNSEDYIEDVEIESDLNSEVTLSFVEEIIINLLGSTSQKDINLYLESINSSNFSFPVFSSVKTSVTVNSLGKSVDNDKKFIALVDLVSENGAKTFIVNIEFDANSSLSKFEIIKL